jgi:two-component system, chemotaxis family, sensor kinase CheA
VVPFNVVGESVPFSKKPGHDYTNLRGHVLPFIHLREMFDIEARATRRQSIVVLKYAGQRAGLVVDTLLGEFQTVIKPLSKVFNHVNCISGSTILGNGEVALILDVSALLSNVTGKAARQLAV